MTEFLPTVPQQRDFSNPLLELREKKVAKWIESLPLHEPADAIELLLQTLTPLNLEPVNDKTRVRLMELYRRPINTIHEDPSLLEKRIADLPPAQQVEIREKLADLLWQLATGYKAVIRSGEEQGRSPSKDALLHLALHRAMEVLGTVLLNAYRQYSAVPPHAYRELHQLYEFAVRHRVADNRAPLDRKNKTHTTIATLYKQALLMAAADPFRLPHGEADQLHRLLIKFAECCTLSRPPWTHASGKFLISEHEDRSPASCVKQKRRETPENSWVLDTNPLKTAMQTHVESGTESERSVKELELLRRILPDLKAPPKRRTPRTRSAKELRVAVGLAATHHFLSNAGAAQLQQARENAAYGIEVYDAESESQVSYLLEPWKVVNESPKGYLLARRHALDESLQVGEALGLFPLHAAAHQTGAEMGVIRWIKHSAENWTHLGVEVLPGRPDAVHCEPTNPDEFPFEEPRALFLNRVDKLPVPPTLVARGGLYRKECAINLKRENHVGQARIGSLIMETSHLVRVTLKPCK